MNQETDPITAIERVDLQSIDVAEHKRQELLRLFPEARTEAGKIDFDRLKLTLGAAVDVGKERYGLTWPGKAECFRTIQTPSTATLRPMRDESVNFDTTENLIIEGDNLEILKLLQKAYLGKVKMIYIDPPYNTGNDFIYPDNYTESLQTYLEYTGQVDSEGKKFSTNTEVDGRFHSKWLNMMHPRLFLARNLLCEGGSIWISIDDNEVAALRSLCNEIFGEENFVATFVWEKRKSRENRRVFSINHDYVVCYARSKDAFEQTRNLLPLSDDARDRYQNPDNDPRGDWQSVALTAQAGHGTPAQFYTITTPSGRKVDPPPGNCWRVTQPRLQELVKDNRIWFGSDGGNVPRQKVFLAEIDEPGLTPHTLWQADEVGTTDNAKRDVNQLFDGRTVFDTPKPVELLQRILKIATGPGDLCLDFFAGSGTTAHAVLDLNRREGSARRFILTQLPEPTSFKEFPTIAAITRERVRRVIKQLSVADSEALKLDPDHAPDQGFRAFALAESNLLVWNSDTIAGTTELEQQLSLHVRHLRPGRTDEDLLFEILMREGFEMTIPSEVVEVGTQTHSLAEGALIISLSRGLNLESIRAIADRGPQRVVCLDEGFAGNDQLKANAAQIFKAKGIVFRTI